MLQNRPTKTMDITVACKRATERFFMTPEQINEGKCFEWAALVFDWVEGSKIAGHNVNGKGHSYIEYQGMFYDAERWYGVTDWHLLPFFQRMK